MFWAGLVFQALPLSAQAVKPAATKARLPADAAACLRRMIDCAHWTGEVAYDAPRGREIAAAVERLRCDAVAADEASLRRRYRRDPAVSKAFERASAGGG
ncbi:hypothetical protein G3T14_21580 [Methylobacterium sp. BTF04]|nr:hypothetical protein [Methylobacterium sp. BTF04]